MRERSSALIVGTGLIGTSIGLALSQANWTVWLTDSDNRAVRLAADLGAGSATAPPSAPDLVIVAVPPRWLATALEEQANRFPNSTLTDVASVKVQPQADADRLGLGERYVGGHPMAGRELSGPAAARGDLFVGRPWVVCAATGEQSPHVARVRAMVQSCGADIVTISAEAHDEAVAAVSHLPQLMASVTAAQLMSLSDAALSLAGQGVRDTVRIAASNTDLWTDVLMVNASAVRPRLERTIRDLQGVLDALGADSATSSKRAALEEVLVRGVDGHARIPGKHGRPSATYAVVPVVIADEPGALARLLTAAGQAGANVEDLAIEHSPGQPVGLVELFVAHESAGALVRALTEAGWSVH